MKLQLTLFATLLFSIAAIAQNKSAAKDSTPTPKPAAVAPAPVLSDTQKLRIKDYQLTDSNLQLQISNAQNQQKQNQQQAGDYLQTLCKSTDGKTYQVKFPELVCIAIPTSAEVKIQK
jgi:hypothetical protein